MRFSAFLLSSAASFSEPAAVVWSAPVVVLFALAPPQATSPMVIAIARSTDKVFFIFSSLYNVYTFVPNRTKILLKMIVYFSENKKKETKLRNL